MKSETFKLPGDGSGSSWEQATFAPIHGEEVKAFAVHIEGRSFVPCPWCGGEIEAPAEGFDSCGAAIRWALEKGTCMGAARARAQEWGRLIRDTPCESEMLARGKCGYTNTKSPCTAEACSAWKPLYYDRALFVRGWNLWRNAQELEAFKPTAQMLAAVLAGPEPAPYWTAPKFPTGVCAYCGQTILLAEPATSAEDADEKATALCQCAAGEAARRHLFERDTIESLFPEISARATALLCEVAALVRTEHLKSGTAIKPWDNVTAKFKLKDGVVTITRTEKREHQQSL